MGFTTTPTGPIGRVRFMLWDLDPGHAIFPDDSYIEALLHMEGSESCAAAKGLEIIAGNRILTLQVIQNLDLKTDGVSVAKGLQALATSFRENDQEWSGIMFAEAVDNSVFALREKYWKMYIQSSGGGVSL
jgi:hypothetical protein